MALVSPGAGQVSIDCDSPGLYLGVHGLKPPVDALVFSVLAGRSSSTFLAIRRARAFDAVTFNSGDRVGREQAEARRK